MIMNTRRYRHSLLLACLFIGLYLICLFLILVSTPVDYTQRAPQLPLSALIAAGCLLANSYLIPSSHS